MNKLKALAVFPASLALALALPGVAQAAPVADISQGKADVVAIGQSVTFDGDTALITASFTCHGARTADVWASVKQLAEPGDVNEDWDFDTHGTSGASAAWYDTHAVVTCSGTNGKPRTGTATFEVHRADFGPEGPAWEQLQAGMGYVQLCVTVGGSETEQPKGFAAYYDWVPVTQAP